jgi:hypothetical protein
MILFLRAIAWFNFHLRCGGWQRTILFCENNEDAVLLGSTMRTFIVEYPVPEQCTIERVIVAVVAFHGCASVETVGDIGHRDQPLVNWPCLAEADARVPTSASCYHFVEDIWIVAPVKPKLKFIQI